MNNLTRWALICLLALCSPALYALGLGGAEVRSYLDQPLDVRIELITRSSDELESVTAGLASAEDFQLLGMNRAAISVPLEFELVTDAPRPYIRVTSDLNVNEPVVQVLVEVVWASGRMLREYTVFLDPPTFESVAPPPVEARSEPAPMPVAEPEQPVAKVQRASPASRAPDVEVSSETEDVPTQTSRADDDTEGQQDVVEETSAEDPGVDEAPAQETTAEEITATESRVEDSSADETAAKEARVEDSDADETGTEESVTEDSMADDGEVYGPVASGETLWGIARDFSRGSGYSINQAMLAIQRKNPDAFIRNNINNLKRGAILRLPALREMGELTSREAMLEAMRQEEEKLTGVPVMATTDHTTPTVADTGDFQASDPEPEPVEPPVIEEDQGHLELVPPAVEESAAEEMADEAEPDPVASAETVRDQLSRTEEELVNARQENTYLTERIKELEAQVASQPGAEEEPESGLAVEDSDLARLESNLEEERTDNRPEPPVAITPGGETQPLFDGFGLILIGLAVFFIAVIVWALWRRSARHREITAGGPVAALAVEAEQILKTMRKGEDGETVVQPAPKSKPPVETPPEPVIIPEPEPDTSPTPSMAEPEFDATVEMTAMMDESPTGGDDEAETVVQEVSPVESAEVIDFADESSDDTEEELDEPKQADAAPDTEDNPEVKLDLARAYLSLGDKEASKSMLEEVLRTGNEEQVEEARQMMDEL